MAGAARSRLALRSYYVSSLVFDSEIEVPEFWPVGPGEREPDVRLRVGDVPASLPDAEAVDDTCQRAGDDVLLTYGEVRFLIRGGREIVMAPGPTLPYARAVLLADPLAILFQQRGLLPIHASAIEVAGKSVAFAAPAGSGKSTLLACLHGRGYTMLCDDLCIVETVRGRFVAHASFPILKLRDDAVAMVGGRVRNRAEALPGPNKHFFRVTEGFGPRSPPLSAIYFLRWSRRRAAPAIRKLRRFDAFKALAHSIFYGALLPRVGSDDPLMTASADLVRSVGTFAFARPRDLDRIDESVELLERHLG